MEVARLSRTNSSNNPRALNQRKLLSNFRQLFDRMYQEICPNRHSVHQSRDATDLKLLMAIKVSFVILALLIEWMKAGVGEEQRLWHLSHLLL